MENNNTKAIVKDMFEYFEELPSEVQLIIEEFNDKLDNCMDYNVINAMIQELNKHGYTCDYSLDCVPYNLREISKQTN